MLCLKSSVLKVELDVCSRRVNPDHSQVDIQGLETNHEILSAPSSTHPVSYWREVKALLSRLREPGVDD
jgi:hypothetical protein